MNYPKRTDMIIIPGPGSVKLGANVATEMGLAAHPVKHRIFPDGESYIRFTSSVEGETVVIIQTTAPNPNRRVMELLFMARTAHELGAERTICVTPYLAYTRQDKRFMKGEVLSLDIVLHFLNHSKVDDLILVDAHSEESLRIIQRKHGGNVHNVSAIPYLATYLKENGFKGAYSLSPDKGAIHLVESAARVIGGEYGYFEKIRDRNTGEIAMKTKDIDLFGQNAIVFDDIISSGNTTARAVQGLKKQGADKVAAACTHALFMENAESIILKAGANPIVVSDTVDADVGAIKVSVAKVISEKLFELL
jgi:ribose-phosphate pyrophosphokinase